MCEVALTKNNFINQLKLVLRISKHKALKMQLQEKSLYICNKLHERMEQRAKWCSATYIYEQLSATKCS